MRRSSALDYDASPRLRAAGAADATTLVADLETPVSAFLKLAGAPAGDMFLLEFGRGRRAARPLFDDRARSRPDLALATARSAEINRRARATATALRALPRAAARGAARAASPNRASTLPAGLPPMAAGVFGYLGYDMVRQMERLPPAKPDPIGVPDAVLIRPTVMVVFDSVRDEIIDRRRRCARQPGVAAKAALRARREARLDARRRRARRAARPRAAGRSTRSLTASAARLEHAPRPNSSAWSSARRNTSRAGDVFQVVLSQRFTSRFDLPPFSLYRALRRVNPSPFLCFLDFGGFQIVVLQPGDPGAACATAR